MTRNEKVILVTAGLVFHRGKLLITQRPAGTHLAGMWEFPGGKQDPGETLPECLARELREELGIEVEVHELLEEFYQSDPDLLFIVEIKNGGETGFAAADLIDRTLTERFPAYKSNF
ncbi:MAG: NUDIX domain-containing protein, partial [Verrucomicrobia bacterium]|nr:NUDIX domain-containing protein [Verrucomicrobiota bacterium]